MTPSETTEQRNPSSPAPNRELASLIEACSRDERPALKALYELTAPRLYGRAIAATNSREDADQALLQTYLAVFTEAEQFDSAKGNARTWLDGILGRHLPPSTRGRRARGNAGKPVEPSAELWQKLDIALGLQRLDRHIKPGIATQPRGRDPMPNAYDRRIERQLRLWRVTGIASFSALLLALASLAAMMVQRPAFDPVPASAAGLADPPAAVMPAERARPAILRAADQGRVWRVDVEADGLRVRSLPPFAADLHSGRPGVLALWVKLDPAPDVSMAPVLVVEGEPMPEPAAALDPAPAMVRLADLDPTTSTGIPFPDGFDAVDLAAAGIEFVISLEPRGGSAATAPTGPVLFAGRFEP